NTAEGWQLSTPSPIMYAAHKASLDIFEAAGFENVVQKGATMAANLISVLEDVNNRLHTKLLQVITPVKPEERGCQVSILMLQNGREVFEALSKNGVFADWREPDVIRIAPVPLYNTFEEIYQFGQLLFNACAAFKN
ncbi:MAG TPA: hypothetical protein VM888_08915, partial [Chitinophagaceae bacterium]|nr:hypothetical protein [Chitinophagaceae bacterium]